MSRYGFSLDIGEELDKEDKYKEQVLKEMRESELPPEQQNKKKKESANEQQEKEEVGEKKPEDPQKNPQKEKTVDTTVNTKNKSDVKTHKVESPKKASKKSEIIVKPLKEEKTVEKDAPKQKERPQPTRNGLKKIVLFLIIICAAMVVYYGFQVLPPLVPTGATSAIDKASTPDVTETPPNDSLAPSTSLPDIDSDVPVSDPVDGDIRDLLVDKLGASPDDATNTTNQ